MKKNLCFMFLALTIIVTLSGCWSRTEPKNLSITNSVLFDIKADGTFQVTKQLMNLSEAGVGKNNSEKASAVEFNCEGKTVAEAVRDELDGKNLFGGNLQARLFSEKFAKNGMMPVLDFLLRDHLTDEKPYMVVVKGENPQHIYSSTTGLSELIGNYIDESSKTLPQKNSESVFLTTLDFMKEYYQEGKQPVMGLVEAVKNELKSESGSQSSSQDDSQKEYRLFYSGLAAFKDDKLVGYMNGTETKAYNFITNKMKSTIVSLPDGITAGKVLNSKSEMKAKIENGQAVISANITVAMSVIQNGANIDISKAGPLKTLEQQFDQQLETELLASIQKAQTEFQSDIFGFGSCLHAQHPDEWKNVKKNWDDLFSKAKVNVKVNSSIVMSGETKNTFSKEE